MRSLQLDAVLVFYSEGAGENTSVIGANRAFMECSITLSVNVRLGHTAFGREPDWMKALSMKEYPLPPNSLSFSLRQNLLFWQLNGFGVEYVPQK